MSDKKQFAIDHMNKDHLLALYDYANAFGGQKLDYFKQSQNQLKLTDVSLDKLHLEWKADGTTKKADIPISPPMKSFGDLRPTVVKMAQDAATKLNVSPYQIKTYTHWDNIIDFIVDASVWFTFALAILKTKLVPYHDNILFRLLDAHVGKLAIGLLIVHGIEVFHTMIPQLQKYRVSSPAYEKWCFATVIGGIFAIKRFQRQTAKLGHK